MKIPTYLPAADSKGYKHETGHDLRFDAAWRHHWLTNKHHPEYWSTKNPAMLAGHSSALRRRRPGA